MSHHLEYSGIRPISICLFISKNQLLVVEHVDKTDGSIYYRPPGGGIKFGESSSQAINREIQEELGVALGKTRLVGIIEDVYFQFGSEAHQHVFIYESKAPDELLNTAVIEFNDGGNLFKAKWIPISEFETKLRLTPKGLGEILVSSGKLKVLFSHHDC